MTELWTSLVAACVGGVFALAGVIVEQRGAASARRAEAAQDALVLMKALRSEIGFLFERYMQEIGDDLDRHVPGHAYEGEWRARADYFVIYRSNAPRIGLLPGDDLRRAIIAAYAMAAAHLETLEFNGELLARDRQRRSADNPFGLARYLASDALGYEQAVLASHEQLKLAVGDALGRLDISIELASKTKLPWARRLKNWIRCAALRTAPPPPPTSR